MTLTRLNPSRSIFSLKSDMDRLFDTFFDNGGSVADSYSDVIPKVDIQENEHEFIIHSEIPGMKKDDIKITFENNYLTISGEKKPDKSYKKEDFHHIERLYGKFSRTMAIPVGVMLDKIDAEYVQGVLTVKIPKAEEAKPKQIAVKVK
ncbi:MAG: Hsp20/alpha crystallin family protein [Calditrichaeota bacterium]|nr:Hsp20/alpha crystallin family protein [Calditrichota bacterium]